MSQTDKVLVVYAALGSGYQAAKIGNSDGTVAGTAPVVDLPAIYTDPRLNNFVDGNGTQKLELCNRGGSPGTQGNGTHWILDAPVGPTLPSTEDGLSDIANPYGMVTIDGILYIIELDTPNIWAVDLSSYELALGGLPAYTFSSGKNTDCGIDIDLVMEDLGGEEPVPVLYVLYNSGDSFAGDWYDSCMLRLQVELSGPNAGRLTELGRTKAGPNATGFSMADYTPVGRTAAEKYLLVSAIGGTQNAGGGNGANSVISVIKAGSDFGWIADPVNGTFTYGGVQLDIKRIAVTPTVSNEAMLFVMAASYDVNWATNYSVRHTDVSAIIERAIAMKNSQEDPVPLPPIDISGFTEIDNGTGVGGYFWTVAFIPLGTGWDGMLVVGRGDPSANPTGDQLVTYTVSSAGVLGNAVVIPSVTLYGDTGCVLNTVTEMRVAAAAGGAKVQKTHRASVPHPVARGHMTMAEFQSKIGK